MVDDKRFSRVAILLPDLHGGGAERVCIYLANAFVARNIMVDMVLMQAGGELIPLLDSRVRIVDLRAPRMRNLYGPFREYLRQTRPTAVLANMWPLTVFAVAMVRLVRLRIRVVVVEHTNWSAFIHTHKLLHRVALRLSMPLLMPYADERIGVSGGVARDIEGLAGLRFGEVHTVFNPVTGVLRKDPAPQDPRLISGVWATTQHARIIAVGALKPQKRFDLLLDAFARLPQPNAILLILGEGAERQALEALAQRLGVHDRVLMPGFVSDPSPFLRVADLFVFSSDCEGFGNVVAEALEQGTPVVSTDCPFGPREILENGKYGALVPVGDAGALAKAMEVALTHEHDREALKRRALDFTIDKAADAYLRLLLGSK